MIESDVFQVPKSTFAAILIQQHGFPWIIGGAMILLTAIFLGIALDYRILLLVVILLFLIAPALLLVLYYNYGMKGKSFLNVLPHRIQIFNENTVIWLRVKDKESAEENREEPDENGAREETDEEWRKYEFKTGSFGKYIVGKNYVVFPFVSPDEGFFYLPVEAFSGEKEFSQAVALMAGTNINKKENENNKR